MRSLAVVWFVLCAQGLLVPAAARADGPAVAIDRLDSVDLAPLVGRGLRLAPDEVRELARAVVRFEGAPEFSGSFVSQDGLILAPYDVARPCIEAAGEGRASIEGSGFHAASHDKELRCPGLAIGYDAVLASERAPEASAESVRRRSTKDVRLVHVPEQALAHFGGTRAHGWPSHRVAYAFLRAYDDAGKPLASPTFLARALIGYRASSLVFALGESREGPWLGIGTVAGLRPAPDAPRLPFATTISGIVASVADDEGHRVSDATFAQLAGSRIPDFKDPMLGDVPVAFAVDLEMRPGGIGAPIVDGTGALLGMVAGTSRDRAPGANHDRALDRVVVLDVRAVLDLLVRLYGAVEVALELGL